MSYHGSVYCGWCCEKGHNRRGCPARKEHIRKEPNSWEAQKQSQEEQRPRRCTYCLESGHNRKTCSELKSDRQFIVVHYKERRAQIAERLVEEGLGVGALVTTRGDVIATVTGFDWKDLNGNLDGDDIAPTISVSMLVQRFDESHVRWLHINLVISEPHAAVVSSVVSPLLPQTVRQCFPTGWLDGTYYKEDRFFEKGQQRHYFFCANNSQDD